MMISEEVHKLYWEEDKNCAMTTLIILCNRHEVELHSSVVDSLTSMPGLGKNGLTCGIVIGAVMFVSLYCKANEVKEADIQKHTNLIVRGFKDEFGSELCSILRPEGFKPTNPPHLCEKLTVKAIEYLDNYVVNNIVAINN